MVVICVLITVKQEFIEEFRIISKFNHENSILEPGNLRFDILQQVDDKNKFTFYEAYIDEDAALAHKHTAHYLRWKETVESFMSEPRIGIKHIVLFPDELSRW